ncbi:hypothetical protein [Flagellimonas nanhaiensis]|uniref:Uncharacterized protein n=1 Tax=Flagellimonas nanhaiensis TaxID=2292706 RepID=A0A371JPS2_9FLAO|nr:hypothetical protein [Allomuricauda nanhaiensis]RDY59525.1 hypothetical protein DX873_09100 [Allomuricauda nanhaiensis]
MIYKLLHSQKSESKVHKSKKEERYYPLYYALTGFLFGAVLVLSALNDFLFFGWLSISMSIVFGLMSIHMVGKNQTKRY